MPKYWQALACAGALHACIANADTGREVLVVFASAHPPATTGSSVSKAEIVELLFTKEPCPLPIVGRETMHRAWSVPGVIGCWYPTLEESYVFVSPEFVREGQSHVLAIPHALLQPDGTALIIEPGYSISWSARREGEWALRQIQQGHGQEP